VSPRAHVHETETAHPTLGESETCEGEHSSLMCSLTTLAADDGELEHRQRTRDESACLAEQAPSMASQGTSESEGCHTASFAENYVMPEVPQEGLPSSAGHAEDAGRSELSHEGIPALQKADARSLPESAIVPSLATAAEGAAHHDATLQEPELLESTIHRQQRRTFISCSNVALVGGMGGAPTVTPAHLQTPRVEEVCTALIAAGWVRAPMQVPYLPRALRTLGSSQAIKRRAVMPTCAKSCNALLA
jgi:hypothetical protein